jgi:hypothetical protein
MGPIVLSFFVSSVRPSVWTLCWGWLVYPVVTSALVRHACHIATQVVFWIARRLVRRLGRKKLFSCLMARGGVDCDGMEYIFERRINDDERRRG